MAYKKTLYSYNSRCARLPAPGAVGLLRAGPSPGRVKGARDRREDADSCTRSAQAPGPRREGGRRLRPWQLADARPRGPQRQPQTGPALSRLLRGKGRGTSRPSRAAAPLERAASEASSALLSPRLIGRAEGRVSRRLPGSRLGVRAPSGPCCGAAPRACARSGPGGEARAHRLETRDPRR